MKRLAVLAALALLLGCTPSPPPAPANLVRLTRVTFAELPGWHATPQALAAFRRGCAQLLARDDAAPMGGAGYAGTVGDWRGACTAPDAPDFFETHFTPFAVAGEALFTGYYEPEIRGSSRRHGAFQTPVYGLPADLVRADLGRFIPRLKGEHISGRLSGHALVPYPDRAAINADGIANAPVLFFTDDPVAFFFLQIQGSGRVTFDDGKSARIAYAGENGQPYTAIGRTLIAEGALAREDVSLQSIRAWLAAHPDQARRVMETDKSYIFFQLTPLGDTALGAKGTLGVALTPLASLAVDGRLHALGVPVYVAAGGPDPVQAVMVAQDTGGAITGAARGDIFFGFGAQAEGRAGTMKAPGRLYVLLPDAVAARIGAGKDFPP